MKTCSVIVPIYNASPYLAQCLTSLMMQTYSSLQIIMVNDGSTDDSRAIAQSFVVADARFTLINQANHGQGAARNRGLKHAQGEYIVFVDADDYLDTDWIEQHVNALDNADYVQSGYRRVMNDEIIESKTPCHRYRFTSPCMRLYRSDFLRDITFPVGMIYEDVIFSLQVWAQRPIVRMLSYDGYNYTYNPASTTTTIHSEAQQTLFSTIRSMHLPLWLKYYTLMRLRAHFRNQSR